MRIYCHRPRRGAKEMILQSGLFLFSTSCSHHSYTVLPFLSSRVVPYHLETYDPSIQLTSHHHPPATLCFIFTSNQTPEKTGLYKTPHCFHLCVISGNSCDLSATRSLAFCYCCLVAQLCLTLLSPQGL